MEAFQQCVFDETLHRIEYKLHTHDQKSGDLTTR